MILSIAAVLSLSNLVFGWSSVGPYGAPNVVPLFGDCPSPKSISGAQNVYLNQITFSCSNGQSLTFGYRGGVNFGFTSNAVGFVPNSLSIVNVVKGPSPVTYGLSVDMSQVVTISGFYRNPGMYDRVDKLNFLLQNGTTLSVGEPRAFMFYLKCTDKITKIFSQFTDSSLSAIAIQCANGKVWSNGPPGSDPLTWGFTSDSNGAGFNKVAVGSSSYAVTGIGYIEPNGNLKYPPSMQQTVSASTYSLSTQTISVSTANPGEYLNVISGLLWREGKNLVVQSVSLQYA